MVGGSQSVGNIGSHMTSTRGLSVSIFSSSDSVAEAPAGKQVKLAKAAAQVGRSKGER